MRKIVLMSMLSVVVGCSTSPTGPDNNETPQAQTPIVLQGTIAADSVVPNIEPDSSKPDYRVSGDLSFAAAVTIQPGVVIHVDAAKAITVTGAGSIVAVGSDSQPIVIRGSQRSSGFWKGLRVLTNNPNNEIAYARVEEGGSGSFTGLGIKANITLGSGARLKLHHAHVRASGGHGIYLEAGSSRLDGFEHNTIAGNALSPAYCKMQHFLFFDTTSSYTGNGTDRITGYFTGVDADVTGNHVWQPIGVPFSFEGVNQSIAGQLTLLPGVTLLASQSAGLIIEQSGSLKAQGTYSRPVEVKGAQDVQGFWRGINILSNSTENELEHVVLANGGSAGFDGANHKTNLILGPNARVKIRRTTIRSSGGWGIFLLGEGAALPDFERNTITDNALSPIRLRVDQFKYLDTASLFTRNGKDWIEQYYQFNFRNVTGDHTWKALSVPYYLTGQDLALQGNVKVESGVVLIAAQNAGVIVAPSGALNAVGTPSSPIVFKGEQDVTGYWRGLRMESASAQNVLTNVTVSNGGSQGFDGANRKASIELASGSRLSISQSTISKSGGVGIRNLGGTLAQSGVAFSGNAGDDVATQ